MVKHRLYVDMDLKRARGLVRTPIFVDARNVHEPSSLREAGWTFAGVGRGADFDTSVKHDYKAPSGTSLSSANEKIIETVNA